MPISELQSSRRALMAMAVVTLVVPQVAWADAAADAAMAKILAGRKPTDGGVKLDIPSIAENGLVVPLTVEADSPMTDADHITAIHVFADGNPNPLVASFRFTPAAGKAAASTRIRLAQTQNVVIFAETSGGEIRKASAEVKVTIGGCGG